MGLATAAGVHLRILFRVRSVATVLTLAPVVARWAGIGVMGIVAVHLVVGWTGVGGERVMMACLALLFLVGMGLNLRGALRSAGWETLAKKWGVTPTDVFLTARQLAEDKTQTIFHERAFRQTQSAFPRFWIRRMWEPRWGWDIALFVGSMGLMWAIFAAGGLSPRQSLDVDPGNGRFARGSDVLIQIRPSAGELRAPQLEVKGVGGAWENRALSLMPDGRYGAVLLSLRDPLHYRVRERLFRTMNFKLTPFDPPQLAGLIVKVTPPAYMDKKSETIRDLLSFKVWAGSVIQWRITLNPVDSLFRMSEGPPLKKVGEEWVGEEKADRSSRRSLWAVRQGEAETAVAEIVVDVESDQPPVITLVGPGEDVTADIQDTVPITAELSDDIGLKGCDLVWRINEGPWRRIRWEDYKRGILDSWLERSWDLSPLLLNHGDRAEFFLEAQDRGVPPGRGRTQTRSVTAKDFRLQHQKWVDEIVDFHRDLRNRIIEQRTVLADLRDPLTPDGVAVSTPPWSALLTKQRQMARRLAGNRRHLDELLDRMDESERVDPDTLLDHRRLAEGLNDVAQSDVPKADQALNAADKSGAETAMDQLASRLDALQKRAEASLREQQKRDLVRDQADLTNRADYLLHSLSNLDALTPEQRDQFQKTVESLEEAVKRIQEKLESLKPASEEWDENRRIETVRFDRVTQALDRLSSALSRSSGSDALAAAKEALEALKEIERQLAQAGAGGMDSDSGSNDKESEVIRRALDSVKSLADRQEQLQSRTMDVVESLRRAQPGTVLSQADRLNLTEGTTNQRLLTLDARRESDALRPLALDTGVLSPRVARSLDAAVESMGRAEDDLVRFNPQPAADHQMRALEHLRNAESKLNDDLNERTSSSLKSGRGGNGGRSFRIGAQRVGDKVPLPKKEDFRSPGTFRRDILDGMKEPVPPDQQPAVQDYYRHWTK